MNKTEPVSKEIQKLESIGKTGKINKVIEITEDHLSLVKKNSNTFSLKVIAYIIKGIFMIFKKNYECVYKDLQLFIELYINGKKKTQLENGLKTNKKQNKLKEEQISMFGNFSLLSENNTLENFLNESTRAMNSKLISAINKAAKSKDELSPAKQEKLDKIVEKSMSKSLSHKADSSETHLNVFDDFERLDLNFIYSKDIFSDFINFNLKDSNLSDQDSKIKNATNAYDDNLFRDFDDTHENKSEIKAGFDFQRDLLISRNRISFITKPKKIKKNFVYDKMTELDNKDTLDKILDKQYMRKNSLKLLKDHYNKNILEKELENFEKSLEEFQLKLSVMNLFKIEENLTQNFIEESSGDFSQKPEKYRYDNSTTAKKRKSIDTSVLSNLSMSEVFENSTDKKLFNKNTSTFNDNLQIPENNIILEEDSNFNMNTFSLNLKNNFNNLELEFPDQNYELAAEDIAMINMELIKEELEKSLNTNLKKKLRRSTVVVNIDLANISKRVIEASQDSCIMFSEIQSILFYQLLIRVQLEQIPLSQDFPFGDILIK